MYLYVIYPYLFFPKDFKPEYDNIGCERYKDLCKEEKIMPFRRVLNSLAGEELTMKVKYYNNLTLVNIIVEIYLPTSN